MSEYQAKSIQLEVGVQFSVESKKFKLSDSLVGSIKSNPNNNILFDQTVSYSDVFAYNFDVY